MSKGYKLITTDLVYIGAFKRIYQNAKGHEYIKIDGKMKRIKKKAGKWMLT